MTVLAILQFFALYLIYCCVNVLSSYVFERLVVCSKDNSTKLFMNVTTENGKQYLNFDVTLIRPIDETVGVTVDVKTTFDGKTYLPLLVIREKDSCKAGNIFLGEMWYSLQRAAQIIPGACPIRAKRYYVHHHLLDLNKITLQALPFGKIRSTVNVIDNNSKNSLFCVEVDVDHSLD